jgi:hypothetical protein
VRKALAPMPQKKQRAYMRSCKKPNRGGLAKNHRQGHRARRYLLEVPRPNRAVCRRSSKTWRTRLLPRIDRLPAFVGAASAAKPLLRERKEQEIAAEAAPTFGSAARRQVTASIMEGGRTTRSSNRIRHCADDPGHFLSRGRLFHRLWLDGVVAADGWWRGQVELIR